MLFDDVLLLFSDIFGNQNVLICKIGRLLLVHRKNRAVSCYVLNSSDVFAYLIQRDKDECLQGSKTCAAAFGIPDQRSLLQQPDVIFQNNLDGSCNIMFQKEPIAVKNEKEFYNTLCGELKDTERLNVFKDLVEMRESSPCRVKVFIYARTTTKLPTAEFDVTINISTASSLLNGIPNYWDIYYDPSESLEFNPIFMKLPKENVRPIG